MKYWLIIQTFTFELSAYYLLQSQPMSLTIWSGFFIAHAIACASFAALCWLFLPMRYKFPIWKSTFFLFMFNFCIPYIGLVGSALGLVLALNLPKPQRTVTWKAVGKMDLPMNPGEIHQAQLGTGSLRNILLNSLDVERRLMAIKAIRTLPQATSVSFLKLALRDLSDDVRLLAYASLEAIEAEINESISVLQKSYKKHSYHDKADQIAQQYWELCYLGIAEGILKEHYLQQAEYYVRESLNLKKTASAHLLLGRVLLSLGRNSEAEVELKKAQQGGLLDNQVIPYLAEAVFFDRDYSAVKNYVQYFPEHQGSKLSQIKEYWR